MGNFFLPNHWKVAPTGTQTFLFIAFTLARCGLLKEVPEQDPTLWIKESVLIQMADRRVKNLHYSEFITIGSGPIL